MKKNSLLLTLVSGVLVFSACKKETHTCTKTSDSSNPNIKKNEIKQKIVVAHADVIVSKIKEFKNTDTGISGISRSIGSQTLPVDSALWLLETVLNYDFDNNTNGQTHSDSIGYIINISNTDSVSSTDLNTVYSFFHSYITQKTSQNNLVKVIDIYAHRDNNQVIISGNIIFTEVAAGNKTEGVCDPYSNITARWSYPLTNNPPFMSCTNYTTTNDGPTLCNTKLNCFQYNPPCNPFFYTNVITYFFDNIVNSYPNALFYSAGPGNPITVCYPPLLTDVQLNTYINGCKNLGISNIPSYPSGYIITNYSVHANMQITPPSPPFGGSSTLWWYLNVTYAIPVCNGGGN